MNPLTIFSVCLEIDMKTIKELISESLTEVAATRDINRQNSISRVYKASRDSISLKKSS